MPKWLIDLFIDWLFGWLINCLLIDWLNKSFSTRIIAVLNKSNHLDVSRVPEFPSLSVRALMAPWNRQTLFWGEQTPPICLIKAVTAIPLNLWVVQTGARSSCLLQEPDGADPVTGNFRRCSWSLQPSVQFGLFLLSPLQHGRHDKETMVYPVHMQLGVAPAPSPSAWKR